MNFMEGSKRRVLIVDDNELNAMFLETALNSLNMDCDAAFEGRVAVEKASSQRYDIIFMDCQMPGMDGYEVVTHIRSLDKPYSDIPIIAISATFSKEKLDKCMKVGMNASIKNPIDIDELRDIIERFIFHRKELQTEKSDNMNDIGASLAVTAAIERLMNEVKFTREQSYMLIKEYTGVTEDLIIKMKQAYLENDFSHLSTLAHQIKGISCNLRLKELQEAAGDIERKSMQGVRVLFKDIQYLDSLINKLNI